MTAPGAATSGIITPVSGHLLSIDDLDKGEIIGMLDKSDFYLKSFREGTKKFDRLRGKTVVNLFLEPSTRTRLSFELAGKRLGADVANFSASNSSVEKGESVADTVRTVLAMQTDVLVVRQRQAGLLAYANPTYASQVHGADALPYSVINAGDGMHSHPTQALLDLATIRRVLGRIDGLRVAIVGDALHSRVARSFVSVLKHCSNEVVLVGPETIVSDRFVRSMGVQRSSRLGTAIEGVDVVYVLRAQRERFGNCSYLPSIREYANSYGIGQKMIKLAKKDAMIMHPGPVNWGIELSSELLGHPQVHVQDQVSQGVALRMAVLERAVNI